MFQNIIQFLTRFRLHSGLQVLHNLNLSYVTHYKFILLLWCPSDSFLFGYLSYFPFSMLFFLLQMQVEHFMYKFIFMLLTSFAFGILFCRFFHTAAVCIHIPQQWNACRNLLLLCKYTVVLNKIYLWGQVI